MRIRMPILSTVDYCRDHANGRLHLAQKVAGSREAGPVIPLNVIGYLHSLFRILLQRVRQPAPQLKKLK